MRTTFPRKKVCIKVGAIHDSGYTSLPARHTDGGQSRGGHVCEWDIAATYHTDLSGDADALCHKSVDQSRGNDIVMCEDSSRTTPGNGEGSTLTAVKIRVGHINFDQFDMCLFADRLG